MPADMCCDGVVYLGSRYSEDQEARQAICECVKSSVSPILPIDFGLVNTLPQACGVSINLPRISFNVDCSKSVKFIVFLLYMYLSRLQVTSQVYSLQSLMECFLVSSATGKSPSTGLCQRDKQAIMVLMSQKKNDGIIGVLHFDCLDLK